MTKPAPAQPWLVHGWTVYAHPVFLDQLQALTAQVEKLRQQDPKGYVDKNTSKRLAAVTRLAFDIIPQDPTRPEYRLGHSLGQEHRHWFRAKFFQQYRLFFRFHVPSKIIVLAWVNDESTKRAYGSDDDAYRVFKKMLTRGRPPSNWGELLTQADQENMPNS